MVMIWPFCMSHCRECASGERRHAGGREVEHLSITPIFHWCKVLEDLAMVTKLEQPFDLSDILARPAQNQGEKTGPLPLPCTKQSLDTEQKSSPTFKSP